MSCKGKLSNLPVISNIDQQFKKLTASNLEGLSPKQKAQQIANSFGKMAGDLKNQIGNQVENFTNDATGKLAELGGLVSGLGTDLKAGIPEDLRGIKKGVADAIQSTKDQIAKQYNGIKDLLSCEESTTSDELTQTQEATKVKSAVMSTSINETKSFSNKELKNISENTEVKEQKTQEITNNTISQGTATAANSKSNKQLVTSQNQSLSALKTVSVENDIFIRDMNKSDLNIYNTFVQMIPTDLKKLEDKIPPPSFEQLDFLNGLKNLNNAFNTTVSDYSKLKSVYNQNQINFDTANNNFNIIQFNLQMISAGRNYLDRKDKALYRLQIKNIQDGLVATLKIANALKLPTIVTIYKAPIVSI